MLWIMRRPWMKGLQRSSLRLVREARRSEVSQSIKRQNRWARRVGLPLLTLSINLLLASIVITTSYFLILGVYEQGYFEPLNR